MEKEYTKKLASEWTTEEKCKIFDDFHEAASILFDGYVKQAQIHPDDTQEVMYRLIDLLGPGANQYLNSVADEFDKSFLKKLEDAAERCDCEECVEYRRKRDEAKETN